MCLIIIDPIKMATCWAQTSQKSIWRPEIGITPQFSFFYRWDFPLQTSVFGVPPWRAGNLHSSVPLWLPGGLLAKLEVGFPKVWRAKNSRGDEGWTMGSPNSWMVFHGLSGKILLKFGWFGGTPTLGNFQMWGSLLKWGDPVTPQVFDAFQY